MNRKVVVIGIAVAIGLCVVLAGRSASGPPDGVQPIAWNEEACAHCGMLIGDPRFAAQLITTSGDVHSFDDPGCALGYIEAQHAEVHRLWFRHGERDEWLLSDRAGFVSVPHTPMEFGLMAVERDRALAIDLSAAMLRGRR